MSDKKLNQLSSLLDAQFADNTKLIALGDPSTGQLFSGTIAQAKAIFGAHVAKYTATGSEGSTLLLTPLGGKTIMLIMREAGPVFEVGSSPGSSEFTFDGTNIVFGAALGAGERLVIIYKYS